MTVLVCLFSFPNHYGSHNTCPPHNKYAYQMLSIKTKVSGWRLGWMVIPEELVEPINSLQQNMFINAPTISQTAALKCWDDDTIAQLEQHVQKYRTSRQVILDQLAHIPQLAGQIAPADGGFYIYVDLGEENTCPSAQLGSVKMCEMLLEEQYVALTPGTDFEDPATDLGDRRFRISYAGGIDTVRQAMERFRAFFPTWIERVQKAKGEKKAKQQQESD